MDSHRRRLSVRSVGFSDEPSTDLTDSDDHKLNEHDHNTHAQGSETRSASDDGTCIPKANDAERRREDRGRDQARRVCPREHAAERVRHDVAQQRNGQRGLR